MTDVVEWPWEGIALPGWIRIEEWREPTNVIALYERAAFAGMKDLTLAEFGAVFRFALLCKPDRRWQGTLMLACKDDAEIEHGVRAYLERSWAAKERRRKKGVVR